MLDEYLFGFVDLLVLALATGFGTGFVPYAPGTAGTLIGIVLFLAMAPMRSGIYLAIVAVACIAGIFICGAFAQTAGASDPGSIVFDEIVGYLVAMFLAPRAWRWIVAGFVIFRAFDIFKPWPIYVVEDRLGLGTAIMADDLLAGVYTFVVLQVARLIIPEDRVRAQS